MLRDSQHSFSSEDPSAVLGARVRELRHDRGMTLKGLGREAGLSHPFLSQLERGLARPSVGSVERIARALEVPVGSLWTAPRAGVRLLRATDGHVSPHADPTAPGGIRELSRDGEALRVCEWSGGSRSWSDDGSTTPGEVLVYVVRGAVEVDVGGTVHTLREGDSLSFHGGVPHRLRRRGGSRTRALYVTTG